MSMKIRIDGEYANSGVKVGRGQVREEYGVIASVWNSEEPCQEKAQQVVKLVKRFLWNKIRAT
jgi:hypothetical protein